MNMKYKPQGSEKINDLNEKAARIAELADFGRNNNSQRPIQEKGIKGILHHEVTASNDVTYGIVQEKNRYYIKKKIDDNYVAIGGEQNLREHSNSSYADATKQLNLMISEINRNTGNTKGINVLENQDEKKKSELNEKKYILKVKSNSEVSSDDDMDLGDSGDFDDVDASDEDPFSDMEDSDMGGGDEFSDVEDSGDEELISPDDTESEETPQGETSIKKVQELTGSLGQTIRELNPEEMTSENIKYVLNSIISAIDPEKLDGDDKDEIIKNLGGGDLNEFVNNLPPTDTTPSYDEINIISNFINEVKKHNRDLGRRLNPFLERFKFKKKLKEIEGVLKQEKEERKNKKTSIEEND